MTTISTFSKRLEGKVALITGGASGIGEYTAKLFAEHGAKIVIADIQDELGLAVVQSIGPSVSTYIHCDVTDETHVQNAVDAALSAYGKLDIMFNNAGIAGPLNTHITEVEKADFERVVDVNITGVFLGMKHAARVMVPARGGCIISMASYRGITAGMTSHAYTCSKHAVVGLTKNLAVELGGYGIRVNCVSPTVVATPLSRNAMMMDDEEIERLVGGAAVLKGVALKVEDVGCAALFLASDESKFVSGHNLVVDGGLSVNNSATNMFTNTVYFSIQK